MTCELQARTLTAPPAKPTWSRELFILCFAFVFVRLPFLFTVPMGEAPDEFAHYWVIRFIKEHLRLPSASEVAAGGPSAVYGSLPQLGYLPHLLTSSFSNAVSLPLFERFGSLLGGLVLLYAGFYLARELFPNKRLLRLALPAVLVFHPQLAFVNAYANNDATSSAISAVLLLITVRSIKYGVTVNRSLAAGALLGWLALSKYSGLAVVPAVAGGLIAAVFINRTPLHKVVLSVSACFAACAAVCGFWFARNFHEFAGDMLGTQTMYKSWASTFHRDLNYHVPFSHIVKEFRWWRMMFFSFWGMFGYMNKYLWRPVYIAYFVYLIAAVVGLLKVPARSLFNRFKQKSMERAVGEAPMSGLSPAATMEPGRLVAAGESPQFGTSPTGRMVAAGESPQFGASPAGRMVAAGESPQFGASPTGRMVAAGESPQFGTTPTGRMVAAGESPQFGTTPTGRMVAAGESPQFGASPAGRMVAAGESPQFGTTPTGRMVAAGESPQFGASPTGRMVAAGESPRERHATIACWSVLWVAVLTNLTAMVWASTGNLGGPQGRYLFTSELPVMALMLLGLYNLGGKQGNRLVLSFLLFNACVCVGSWIMLFWMYGFHANPL